MSRKKEARPTFKEVLSETRQVGAHHRRDGHASSRVTDDGLWDAEGLYWPRSYRWLRRAEVARLVNDPKIRAGVQAGYGRPVRFFPAGEARRAWLGEVRDHFADDGDLAAG